jgi:hypothetical protein
VLITEPFINVQPENSAPFREFPDLSDLSIRGGTYEMGASENVIIERDAARFSICPRGLE